MKATLTFNMSDLDDEMDHRRCMKSLDMALFIFDFSNKMRRLVDTSEDGKYIDEEIDRREDLLLRRRARHVVVLRCRRDSSILIHGHVREVERAGRRRHERSQASSASSSGRELEPCVRKSRQREILRLRLDVHEHSDLLAVVRDRATGGQVGDGHESAAPVLGDMGRVRVGRLRGRDRHSERED